MKRQITFAILLFSSLGAFAQVTREDFDKEIKPLTQKVNSLQSENSKLKSEIGTLNIKLSNANKSIDSLRSKTQENSSAISQTANQLGIQITTTEQTANKRIDEVGQSLSKNSLYGIIGVLSAILLSGLLYWLLSKRQQTAKTDFIDQLSKTKSSIEESLVKEFGKQTELMD
jgi:septal ring factor EnvC (AmiA/AmiB activator)